MTATSRAAAAEDAHGAAQEAAEEARQAVKDLRLDLAAAQAELEAVQAAAERESEVARGWEDAAARAESAWMESQQEVRAARAQAAAADERADRNKSKLESNAKLDEVLQRLATRSFGPFSAGEDGASPRSERAGTGAGAGAVFGPSFGIPLREDSRSHRHRAEQTSTALPVHRGRGFS